MTCHAPDCTGLVQPDGHCDTCGCRWAEVVPVRAAELPAGAVVELLPRVRVDLRDGGATELLGQHDARVAAAVRRRR